MSAELDNVLVHKDDYYKELEKFYKEHEKSCKKPWTFEKIREISDILISSREAKDKGRRNNKELYFSRIYETMEIGGTRKIIKKRSEENDEITFIIAYEEFYNKLVEIHISTGNGGRDKMLMALKPKYAIPRPAVEIFVRCCTTCAEKKQLPKKGLVVKPIISKDFNHRGQVDLIDLQSTPDEEYKWLMNYQDHLTKFIHLRPLKSKNAKDVCEELLKIFLEFGAPIVLQSDNGREFVNHIIQEMVANWPSCKIINGRPRHPQSQGSVERLNQDVENMLRAWLKDNSTNWSLGCYFVQWQKNSSYHRIIKRSPYKALFGVDFRVGLFSTNLPSEIIETINTEDDLETILNNSSVDDCSGDTSSDPYETTSGLYNDIASQQIDSANNNNEEEYSTSVNEEIELTVNNTDGTIPTDLNNTNNSIIFTYELEEPREEYITDDLGANKVKILHIDDCNTTKEFSKKDDGNISQPIFVGYQEENIAYVSTQKCIECDQNNSSASNSTSKPNRKCNLCKLEETVKSQRKGCVLNQKRAAEKCWKPVIKN